MTGKLFLLILLSSTFLLAENEQASETILQQEQPLILPKPYENTTALDAFLMFMGQVRSATPHAGVAKTKAVSFFTDLYNQANEETRAFLSEFVHQLSWITGRRLMFASTKNKLCLLLLNQARTKLEYLTAAQPGVTVRIKKSISTLYTAINPTFGDFWRNVRIATGITLGVTAAVYLGYQVYRLKQVLEEEKGPFNKLIKLLWELHQEKDELGKSEFIKLCTAIQKTLSSTEKGTLARLLDIVEHAHAHDDKLVHEFLRATRENMVDPTPGTTSKMVDILNVRGVVPALIPALAAWTKAKQLTLPTK